MSPDPAISVIVPLYNKQPYIARAVRSVLEQTFRDFELIVVDDGSTDGGADELASFQSDPRLRIIRQANAGVSAARNTGLREMRADVAAFLDGDDQFLPAHLEALQTLADEFPNAGLLATGYEDVMPNGSRVPRTIPNGRFRLLEDYFAAACRYRFFLSTSACAVRRRAVAEVGGFLEGVPKGEDVEYWARVALRFPVAYDARPSSLYSVGVPGGAMADLQWDPKLPAVVETLSRALQSDRQSGPRQSAIDYAARVLLYHAATGIATSHRRAAQEILRHPLIRESRFVFGRTSLRFAAGYLPDYALRGYLRLRQTLGPR
ncbi:MAG: glycosyltransferase family 2 protein [Candidatus Baltobacteraceae bacterium]